MVNVLSQQSVSKYSLATRIFHWVGALLIVMAWVAIKQGDEFISLHKAIGASFLLWTILRVINRLISKAPAPVAMPKWQTALAHLTHFGLYLAMFAMPISGMLLSMYWGMGVDIFGIVQIPAMVAPDREMARLFNEIHTEIVFMVLMLLVAAHVGAALYHQFVVKDNLIARMK